MQTHLVKTAKSTKILALKKAIIIRLEATPEKEWGKGNNRLDFVNTALF